MKHKGILEKIYEAIGAKVFCSTKEYACPQCTMPWFNPYQSFLFKTIKTHEAGENLNRADEALNERIIT